MAPTTVMDDLRFSKMYSKRFPRNCRAMSLNEKVGPWKSSSINTCIMCQRTSLFSPPRSFPLVSFPLPSLSLLSGISPTFFTGVTSEVENVEAPLSINVFKSIKLLTFSSTPSLLPSQSSLPSLSQLPLSPPPLPSQTCSWDLIFTNKQGHNLQ